MICLFLFTVSSLLCGIAPSLGLLLFFRVLQGAGGGGLQPMAQAILADTFPPQQRGLAFALYGITAVTAPTIGPTLGGWITFNYSWRWIFFINLPVGMATLFLVLRFVEDPPYLKRLRGAGVKLDYIGIALLTLGVGALQVLLDKGQEDDWFGSHFITTLVDRVRGLPDRAGDLGVVSQGADRGCSLIQEFQLRQLELDDVHPGNHAVQQPGDDAAVPADAHGVYRRRLRAWRFPAEALLLLVEMPIMGQLTTKVQARYLIAFGWLCLAIAMFYSTKRIDLMISFSAAAWLRVAQVIGMGFLFVPITLVAYIGIPPEKNNAVAGIVNFMRNIGSSVGTSLVTTLIARRSQYHQEILGDHIRADNPNFQNAANGLAAAFEPLRIAPRMKRRWRPMPAFTRAFRRRQAAWPILILSWFLRWERRSCSFWLLF